MGNCLHDLASYYAKVVAKYFRSATCLYSPAYKGIPLCVGVSMVLWGEFGRSIPYSFNRKEFKDHGEATHVNLSSNTSGPAGQEQFVGWVPSKEDKVIVLDDVITSGSSLIESVEILERRNVEVAGVIVAVNRQERGLNGEPAREWFEKKKIPFYSLVTLNRVIKHPSANTFLRPEDKERIQKRLTCRLMSLFIESLIR